MQAPPLSPNWALTDWAALESSLKATTIPPPPPLPTTRSLDICFKTNLDKVTAQFALHTLLKKGHIQVQALVDGTSVTTQEGIQLRAPLLEQGPLRRPPPGLSKGRQIRLL